MHEVGCISVGIVVVVVDAAGLVCYVVIAAAICVGPAVMCRGILDVGLKASVDGCGETGFGRHVKWGQNGD